MSAFFHGINDMINILFAFLFTGGFAHHSKYRFSAALAQQNPSGISEFIGTFIDRIHDSLFAESIVLVINHNILWSMVLHILNNSIACLAIYIGLATLSPTTLSGEGHQIEIRPLILNKNVEPKYWPTIDGDTLTYTNELDLMAINLLEWDEEKSYYYFNDTVVYYESSATHVKYNMQVVFDADAPHDYTAVVRTLESNDWLRLDTTVEQAYMITILDSTMRTEPDSTNIPMWVGAYTLQRNGLPILQPEEFNYSEWPVKSTRKLNSMDEARQLLEQAGLGLEPCGRKITMIRITTLYDPLSEM